VALKKIGTNSFPEEFGKSSFLGFDVDQQHQLKHNAFQLNKQFEEDKTLKSKLNFPERGRR
jgi:hypothetical protein